MPLCFQVSCLLSNWITALLESVPLRSRATFVELFCGGMLSKDGWVTSAISAIQSDKHWTTYYKLLQRGSIKTQTLAVTLFRLIQRVHPNTILTVALDDSLVPRQSTSAPGSAIHFDLGTSPITPASCKARFGSPSASA